MVYNLLMINKFCIKSTIMTITTIIIAGILFLYVLLNGYLYFFQRDLLYNPSKTMEEPHHYGLHNAEIVTLNTADNVKIQSWHIPAKEGYPTIIYFHGNTGNLGDRSERFLVFEKTGMGLMMLSYRGFGNSEGSPSEEGLYSDARAIINYVLKEQKIPIKNIVLYGESLGTGVASKMAIEFPNIRSLVLEAPYTSIASRAADLYPYAPVRMILKDDFSNIDKLPNINVPVLIFHGYLDETMPIEHSRKLLRIANEPKEARFFEQVGHTNFDFKEVSRVTKEFVQRFQ